MKKMCLFFMVCSFALYAQKTSYNVVAYFSKDSLSLYDYRLDKVTHLIYAFGHVKDGAFVVENPKAKATLRAFVDIKKKYPHLKLMIALGGWGGCEFCSQTFDSEPLTKTFVASVKTFLDAYHLDGIDLDWEYPVIEGFPKHRYAKEDKQNFTRLVQMLRFALGKEKIITFAAGGFSSYLRQSIDWNKVNPYVDFVNLMTYDLVGGYSKQSGHHTPLYSTYAEEESCDKAVRFFKEIGFPLHKLMLGAAFYSREFSGVERIDKGIYQPAKFLAFVDYKDRAERHSEKAGFSYYWDDKAKAPYWYNSEKKIFVTGDDPRSIGFKCAYIQAEKLGGIMFWELACDSPNDGLCDAINLE